MYFCVFSFNRGQLLKNCVESIELCAIEPKVIIFDDNSNDSETITILESLKKKYKIVQPDHSSFHMNKCGGLYNNMQMSLDYIPDNEFVCFVQDDSQLVRKLDKSDLDNIELFFNKNPNSTFLNFSFLKGKVRKREETFTLFNDESNCYFKEDANQSAGVYFSAICIAKVDNLKSKNWQFLPREKYNNTQAKSLYGAMGFLKNPFLMQLPSAPAYRGKTKTLGLSLGESYNECGFHPVNIMSPTESKNFINRSPETLPIAEDFLSLKYKELRKPWAINPFQGTKICKPLHKAELIIRNLFK